MKARRRRRKKIKNPNKFISQCEHVLEIDPNNVKGFYRRGSCHFVMGETEMALTDFHKVKIFTV